MCDDRVSLFDTDTTILSYQAIPQEFVSKFKKITVCQTICCNILFLCKYSEDKGDKVVDIWNPVLKKMKWIESSISYKCYDVLGFGYDHCEVDEDSDSDSDEISYKVLKFSDPKTLNLRFLTSCLIAGKPLRVKSSGY